MIKEKTVYYSTETGKEYNSLIEAILEDNASGSSSDEVSGILHDFKAVKQAFQAEISSAKAESEESLAKRIAEIHSKYDTTLDSIAEQLAKCGVELSGISETKDGCKQEKKPCRRARVVKVRVVRNPNPGRCFL